METQNHLSQQYYDIEETAQLLHISTQTLRRWNRENRGPTFARIGRKIVYSQKAITNFFNKHLQRENL